MWGKRRGKVCCAAWFPSGNSWVAGREQMGGRGEKGWRGGMGQMRPFRSSALDKFELLMSRPLAHSWSGECGFRRDPC